MPHGFQCSKLGTQYPMGHKKSRLVSAAGRARILSPTLAAVRVFGGFTRRHSGPEPTGLWCTVGMLSTPLRTCEPCRGVPPNSSRQMLNTMWVIEKIEISGGFLPGLSVTIPQGLTCIIGARGSGKSTLVEAVRFALCGISAAPKHCADLIQANLAGGALVMITALADGSNRYTIKRGLKQNPVLLTSDSRAINTVDLDRGTFLPLDAYSSIEIETCR